MNFDNYYVLKYDSKLFNAHTILKCHSISDSGSCYLFSDVDDTKREWIMITDVYPFNSKIISKTGFFNTDFDSIVKDYIKNHS